MAKNIEKFAEFIFEDLGVQIEVKKWSDQSRLPYYLRNQYEFYKTRLLDEPLLIWIARDDQEQAPASVRKHFDRIREDWGLESIYVPSSMTTYNRKRFIEQKIPFVLTENQMYLPTLGIDLREHITKIRSPKRPKVSPSTQTVVLYALLKNTGMEFTPSSIADGLGYSPMTMGRAFDELETMGLGKVEAAGRERVLYFEKDKRHLWDSAKQYLNTPLKKRVHIKSSIKWAGTYAGLTALSHYSMLAEPINPEFAISSKEWNEENRLKPIEQFAVPELDPSHITLEIWNYEPRLFSENGMVDRLSLYLSLRNHKDERIEAALHEMIDNIEW